MAPHDLVLVVGLAALAVLQVVIHMDCTRHVVARSRRGNLPFAPVRIPIRGDAPARWPRA
jgi:hypothetical protein